MGMDTRADDAVDGQWMTYVELGKTRGISKESALKLALRRKWRKQSDNRGHVRVYVPIEWVEQRDMGADKGAEPRVDVSMDMSVVVKPLEAAIMTLREQLAAVRADLDREQTRANKAEQAREAEREAAERRVDQAEARATSALALLRDAAETLKTEQAAKVAAEAKAAEAQAAAEAKTAELQQTVDALQEEAARVATQAKEAADRPAMVASKIDEVQFRRLQEAEQARKSLGRLARLRAAWRGE
jgi:hypothetical protein